MSLVRLGPGSRRAVSLALALVLALAGSLSAGTAAAQDAAATTVFYVAAEGRYEDLLEAIHAQGGSVAHSFPPSAAVASGDPSLPDGLRRARLARYAAAGPVPETVLAALPAEAARAAAAWNSLSLLPTGHGDPAALTEPSGPALAPPDTVGLSAQALDPSLYQQSEFLIGTVVINLVLLQSDGSVDPITEAWAPEEKQLVLSQVMAAANWWRDMEPRAALHFVYNTNGTFPVPVSYEPINRPRTDERLWISQAMQRLGHVQPSYLTAVRYYNRAVRRQHGADWAFTIFVVDSSNDADNRFADGYFAYAYVNGPFMVMTYGNNGYGPENMAAVVAHEMGHIFGALDQYAGAGVSADTLGGYLGVPNGNSEIGGITNVDCIMRGGIRPYTERRLSYYAAGQVGWLDSDGDGILDPVDTAVSLAIELTGSDAGVTITGLAGDVPYASPRRNPITINRIAAARYRINDGPWRPLPAADGAFDTAVEALAAALPPAPAGDWTIEVLAENGVGNSGSATGRLSVEGGPAPAAMTLSGVVAGDDEAPVFTGTAVAPPDGGHVLAVEYRLGSGPWVAVAAADGAYDSPSESFTITLHGLPAGRHDLSLRAWTSCCWVQAALLQQVIEVSRSPEPGPDPDPEPEPSPQPERLLIPIVSRG